jgi:hypothetical protein
MLPSYAQARFLPREPLVEPERHLVVLGPPVSAAIHLHMYGDRFVMEPTSDATEHEGALTMDPLTYVLLFTGRLTWQQAIETGTVSVTGRQEFTVGLLPWFQLG